MGIRHITATTVAAFALVAGLATGTASAAPAAPETTASQSVGVDRCHKHRDHDRHNWRGDRCRDQHDRCWRRDRDRDRRDHGRHHSRGCDRWERDRDRDRWDRDRWDRDRDRYDRDRRDRDRRR